MIAVKIQFPGLSFQELQVIFVLPHPSLILSDLKQTVD